MENITLKQIRDLLLEGTLHTLVLYEDTVEIEVSSKHMHQLQQLLFSFGFRWASQISNKQTANFLYLDTPSLVLFLDDKAICYSRHTRNSINCKLI